jgi:hypothetical protein
LTPFCWHSFGFRCLHPARRIFDVWKPFANARAKQLHARAGAGRFDNRRAEPLIGASDALGDHLREGIDRRRADGAHLRARLRFGGNRERHYHGSGKANGFERHLRPPNDGHRSSADLKC